MSEEISLKPQRVRSRMDRLSIRLDAVVPEYNVSFDGRTEVDTLKEAEQNMQAMEALLQSYKALLQKNVEQVHRVVDQYEEADQTVSSQIKGG
ncbi:YwqI/YxiC family protein [Alkalihalophilus sp. As8PL]|uniref:YwqI/YxiC family protein n=1 Tax=Alkalihalophilus sp. As8PL TaxID=3237103 RepID=A0AB39BVB5_9BACI